MKNVSNKLIMSVSRLLFALYLILLAYFLFFSEHYGRTIISGEYRYNLTPFKEVKRFIEYRNIIGPEGFIVNIFGNIFAFAPFGFVLPIISPDNRKLLNITLLSLEFSLTIELLQLIFKVGIFDVDDLMMNTLGGFLGGVCFILARKLLRSIRRGKR
ncbi:Glycopeptide antibiotics resistance protein [Anaerocolumna jejuensis DSM 15929]|uniref:Glycopeptide antibiotics resistance protein n=1 Tax=Anaerocolumna jejuensis DSM 15929 TaxID=1121322 RepID=A0A1M6R4W8_9FIRM|nr:VanZ family protein [Anaerocolumna jejuensis]SHK27440.1 Glycopeptide antibiotics resistance protein [Anaerocolumna jejuensis DSM 15929]